MSDLTLITPVSDGVASTILLVEDEVLIRLGIAEYLRDYGFKIIEAGEASEAIQIMQDDETHIDLVFSDVMMPGAIDGIGLAHWVRENRPGVRILLTSGVHDKLMAVNERLDGTSFVAKPYDIEFAIARIRTLIKPRTTA